jgi:hypothetical protein
MPSKCICHMRVLRRSIEMNIVLCFTIIQPRTSPEISSPLFYSRSNYSQRLKFPSNLPVSQTRHQYGCCSNPHIFPTSYNELCLPIISPQDRSFTPSHIRLPTNHGHTKPHLCSWRSNISPMGRNNAPGWTYALITSCISYLFFSISSNTG